MSRHRGSRVRPRYGRITVATLSSSVTAVAVLGGLGVLPSAAQSPSAQTTDRPSAGAEPAAASSQHRVPEREDDPTATAVAALTAADAAREQAQRQAREQARQQAREEALPAGSGTGRRVVYSESRQRVWLVERGDRVTRTYLVSGSVHDNLDPGTYAVYSRSEQAWGIDDSGTMRWFVRFAQGDRAAIGFHDIPVDDGARVQTVDQLGTPLSHGCIRQRPADARALWAFAPLGTTVVVTA